MVKTAGRALLRHMAKDSHPPVADARLASNVSPGHRNWRNITKQTFSLFRSIQTQMTFLESVICNAKL
jgi:hypothetical protein